jgi:hypothetical protein
VWENVYDYLVAFLVFITNTGKEAGAKFIFLPQISHTKVWEMGVGSKQKCGKM